MLRDPGQHRSPKSSTLTQTGHWLIQFPAWPWCPICRWLSPSPGTLGDISMACQQAYTHDAEAGHACWTGTPRWETPRQWRRSWVESSGRGPHVLPHRSTPGPPCSQRNFNQPSSVLSTGTRAFPSSPRSGGCLKRGSAATPTGPRPLPGTTINTSNHRAGGPGPSGADGGAR